MMVILLVNSSSHSHDKNRAGRGVRNSGIPEIGGGMGTGLTRRMVVPWQRRVGICVEYLLRLMTEMKENNES